MICAIVLPELLTFLQAAFYIYVWLKFIRCIFLLWVSLKKSLLSRVSCYESYCSTFILLVWFYISFIRWKSVLFSSCRHLWLVRPAVWTPDWMFPLAPVIEPFLSDECQNECRLFPVYLLHLYSGSVLQVGGNRRPAGLKVLLPSQLKDAGLLGGSCSPTFPLLTFLYCENPLLLRFGSDWEYKENWGKKNFCSRRFETPSWNLF